MTLDYEPHEDTKLKRYIDKDVYTAAKERIKHIIAVFDTVLVSFSGGKDSLVTLHLVKEVYEELGIKEKVKVAFRDEEVIPDEVVQFVQGYAESGDFEFYYYCVPLRSAKFLLGKTMEYVQWDTTRPWVRQKPPYAISLPEGDNRVFDQYTTDAFIARGHKGRVAFVNGIRADESLVRFRASVNKRNENYINASSVPNVMLCKPIYDWTEKDIFKYLYDHGIRYCPIYDMQVVNGDGLRVATPFHAHAAKRLDKVRTLSPTYYDQLMAVFPEMDMQARYWSEYDRKAVFERFPKGWHGIFQYIDAEFDDVGEAEKAKKRVRRVMQTRETNLRMGKEFGMYPVLHVFKAVVNGDYKHEIPPKKSELVSKEEREYEAALEPAPEGWRPL